MKLLAAWAWLCAVAALAACTHPLPPPAPPEAVDSGAPFTDAGASCVTACENIFSLGCTDKATKCVDACENVQASGVFEFDVACITRARDCAAINACQQTDNTQKGP